MASQAWANEFSEITPTLAGRPDIRDVMSGLIATRPIPGKVLEGGNRLEIFRGILKKLVAGEISLDEAIRETAIDLAPHSSPHGENKRVFPQGWHERLVRTQLSRFYNQAVLELLSAEGMATAYVPRSSTGSSSQCSVFLVGKSHDVNQLLAGLVEAYEKGNWNSPLLKIPEHPHCSHVVRPSAP